MEDFVFVQTRTCSSRMDEGDAAETLVFQCDGCRRIVGDSYAWCGAYAELSAVSLPVVGPDVEVGTELLTVE